MTNYGTISRLTPYRQLPDESESTRAQRVKKHIPTRFRPHKKGKKEVLAAFNEKFGNTLKDNEENTITGEDLYKNLKEKGCSGGAALELIQCALDNNDNDNDNLKKLSEQDLNEDILENLNKAIETRNGMRTAAKVVAPFAIGGSIAAGAATGGAAVVGGIIAAAGFGSSSIGAKILSHADGTKARNHAQTIYKQLQNTDD